MNREDLENLVIEHTGRSDKTSLIRTALNLAVEEVSSQHLWSDLLVEDDVTLASGETGVDLASDLARLSEVRVISDSNSRVLRIRPKTWLVQKCPDVSSRSAGRPTYGYLEGTRLVVMPLPDADYTIRYSYYRLHPELTDPTSEVLIRKANQAVVAYATFWVFQSIEKHTDAEMWLKSYLTLLNSAKKVDRANSAVIHRAEGRGEESIDANDYWLDPFVRSMP